MNFNRSPKTTSALLIALAFIASTNAVATDISTEPLNTYSAASSTDVKPNVFFVLDDSGSMDWDFMPDWACSRSSVREPECSGTGQNPRSLRLEYLFRNSAYNGVYYNPAVVYKPPVAVDSTGALNTTTYPSMTGTVAAAGADSSAKPNWTAVKDDAYGIQGSGVSNLQSDVNKPPYFFTTVAGEYCTSPSLRTCVTSNVPTVVGGVEYKYPAKLRWCDSSALTNCGAAFSSTFSYARMASPSIATITITGSSSTSVSGITVGTAQIMAGTVAAANSPSILARDIADQINKCTISKTGNCQVEGYVARNFLRRDSTDSGNTYGDWYAVPACTVDNQGPGRNECRSDVLTITAPVATANTPLVTKGNSGSMTFTTTAFSAGTVPGKSLVTIIKPSLNSYPYPGSTEKAVTRSDCAGTTCTYAEEMTNYANWWTYYRTRMQMMKTAASIAFATIDKAADLANNVSRFRLGYMSINNNTGTDFLNLNEFKTSQKYNWYSKLINARPNSSTPLREALSNAGRLYAGKLNGQSFNGVTVADPLQYSCQQNYTILSTDGFWNGNDGFKLDGSTAVGNQDAGLPRPYYDGGSAKVQATTSTLRTRTAPLYKGTKATSNSSVSWQRATSCTPVSSPSPYPRIQCAYDTNNPTAYTNASSCTVHDDSGSTGTWTGDRVDCQYTNWTSWSDAATCTPVARSASPNYTVSTATDCQDASTGGTLDTLADVAAYYYKTDLRSDAQGSPTGTCDGPIIPPSTTPSNLCTDNVQSYGRDVATTQHMTTFTLGLGAQGKMIYAPNDGKDYWNDTTGDFFDVFKGNTANPTAGVCSWQTGGSCNWPAPAANSNANIDDLWHAAINGHGSYFSASDPESLAKSLTSTLEAIINTPRPGTAAAAASSNPNVSASDNFVFSSSYKSVEWYGELIRQRITEAGALTAQNWSAMKLVDCATTGWQPSTGYVVGNVFRQGTACYTVTKDYTSGTTFDGSLTGLDTANTELVNVDESAQSKVPVTAPTARTIYTKGTISGTTGLIPFNWTSLVSASLDSNFTAPRITYVSNTVGLSQFCPSGGNCLSAAAQSNITVATGGAAGEALVNFLRGDRSNEGTFFRKRIHVLGDIVSSEARYVQAPLFAYSDTNYSNFKTAQATRPGTVYVGANDGMLHAFDATSGKELWAYVPSTILPDMYKLADKDYATKHQFFVDSSPETGDICPNAPGSTCTAAQWKTILVGGLNRGGKGYYAMDITDPAAPKLLWEFTDATLGYTYANPKITKLKNGTWVVLVSSGYNNADGVGRLYVLNANTGAVIRTISTGAGTAGSPSGIARISAHAAQPMTDNTSSAAYGGDTLGNLWRFDINGDIGASGYEAHLLINVKDASGNPQPITVKPLEATINGKPVVFVGTGRFLGVTDVTDQRIQSFYAVMDKLDQTTYGDPRVAASNFVKQTLSSTTCPAGTPTSVCSPGETVRTSSGNSVDWSTKNGWFLDFLAAGERSSTDPSLGLGTLLFTTITPQTSSASACLPEGPNGSGSFIYALDYLTGAAVQGSNGVIGRSLGTGLVTRPVMIEQSDGTVRALIRTSSGASSGTDLGGTIVITPPIKPSAGSGTRRVSWRLLTTQ